VNALSIHSGDTDDADNTEDADNAEDADDADDANSLPTALNIHSNSDTSGFHVPSALVNITYIPTPIICSLSH
jgi:hypothetical protein